MRKTNRRRTNNRKRKTLKKQKTIRGGDANWKQIKHIPVSKAAFMQKMQTDTVDGNRMALYNNIYWNDMDGMVNRADTSYHNAEYHNEDIPYSVQDKVTKDQLGEIYVWMLQQDPYP